MRASMKNSTKLDLFASFASPTLPSLFENDSSIDPNFYFANNNPGALSLICEQAFSDSKGNCFIDNKLIERFSNPCVG